MSKSQSGINAAVLIAIIAGLIILYILFLPSVERERFLEGKEKKTETIKEEDKILLKEFPGRIDIIKDIEEKDIPNVFLFETTNAKELEKFNPFIVRYGWFDKKAKTLTFSFENVENIDNVILTFSAKKHDGVLSIKLNNELIFENDIESETVEPITLRKGSLDKQNTLEFSVSSVGYKFWRTNEYTLDGIRIIGDITDKSRQEAQNVFNLKSEEFINIEKATLKFIPYCSNVPDVGVLEISINGRNIFSAIPVCEDAYRQIIPTGIFNSGANNIIFKTNKGSYSIEQIKFEFEAKETKTKVFFFEINETFFKKIMDNNLDVILTLEFVNDKENKRADININDMLLSLDQEEKVFTKNIKSRIRQGNNFIEIRPRTVLDIVEVKVEVQD